MTTALYLPVFIRSTVYVALVRDKFNLQRVLDNNALIESVAFKNFVEVDRVSEIIFPVIQNHSLLMAPLSRVG